MQHSHWITLIAPSCWRIMRGCCKLKGENRKPPSQRPEHKRPANSMRQQNRRSKARLYNWQLREASRMREVRVYDGDFPAWQQMLAGGPGAAFPKEVWLQHMQPGEFAVPLQRLQDEPREKPRR